MKSKKPKNITARSITLIDGKGKARICLDAGKGDGRSYIDLWGEGGRSIQISTSPDGGLYISLYGKGCTASATLGMQPDERAGLVVMDTKGKLGIWLGAQSGTRHHGLIVCKDGKPYGGKTQRSKRKK